MKHIVLQRKRFPEQLSDLHFVQRLIYLMCIGVLSVYEGQAFRVPEEARRQLQTPWGEGYRWL